MGEQKPFLISPALIILDLLGTALIGLGLAEKFAQINFVPVAYQYDQYEWVLIGLGLMILIPTARVILATIHQNQKRGQTGKV